MGVFAFQVAEVKRKKSRDMSLYIRYLHMQVWKEAMWDGPLPNIPLCPSSSKGANEQHHRCWQWPRVTSIPASSRLDLRTYWRLSWVGMSYYIGLKRMVHWSTETLHRPICSCVKRFAFSNLCPNKRSLQGSRSWFLSASMCPTR